MQRNKEKKKEKVTVVTDQIKEDSNEDEIDDAELFELKSDKLAKALELIQASEKMILLMKYQDDMSIKEIADTLELGESAVKMRLKRAKQKVIIAYNEL
ncbi:RNA polymerase sigma factor [Tenacibaculum insulae]|uniref:RNA polymerase sigma factor n=1 Tax=Tenacibaculum insulae TaxID=2029677 RepID=UPI003AB572A1